MKNALRDSAAGKEKFLMVFWLQMDQLGWLQEERKYTWKSGSNSNCEAELIETEYVQVVIVSGGVLLLQEEQCISEMIFFLFLVELYLEVVFRSDLKLGVDQDNQKRVAGLEKHSFSEFYKEETEVNKCRRCMVMCQGCSLQECEAAYKKYCRLFLQFERDIKVLELMCKLWYGRVSGMSQEVVDKRHIQGALFWNCLVKQVKDVRQGEFSQLMCIEQAVECCKDQAGSWCLKLLRIKDESWRFVKIRTLVDQANEDQNMAKSLVLSLTLAFLFIGMGSARDWNILNQFKGLKPTKTTTSQKGVATLKDPNLTGYCESWRINYEDDVERAVDEAILYLGKTCCEKKKCDGMDAWIFDIDDTLLSTIPYHKSNGCFGGEQLNTTKFEEWQSWGKAPAVPNMVKLFHEIRERGFKIFLVSSRKEYLRSATVENLIEAGYHGWSNLLLRGEEEEKKSVTQYKADVRTWLTSLGYKVWGVMGAQWNSFAGCPVPKRTFKLPNSIYYIA
ncbi:hypothetical protein F2Q69_00023469 [Brassica cretica]|uniref:Acid phosphatase n=1 Tax=Brassica cretica TaxID=69181 RepID=A0A8S9QMW8_BRACR|nr:hypothetical protein F2Q69_00023469 [Brassica cretica]